MIRRLITPLPATLCLLLAACLSVPPRETAPDLATTAPLDAPADAAGRWPTADWWRSFRDPQLDTLVERALAGAPDIVLAERRFEQARQGIALQRAAAGASIAASAGINRQRLSDNGLIPPQFLGFNWYTQGDLGAQLQYDFDFRGSHRAAIEAAVGQAHAAAAERDAARLALSGAVADTYFAWQTAAARRDIADRRIEVRRRDRDIAAARVTRGIDNANLLDQAEVALAGAREQRAELDAATRMQRAALAALLGISIRDLPAFEQHPLPTIDAGLPADIGIDLVARRPDIVASRWRVEAALHKRDAARAAFYPDFSLGALLGLSSIDLGKLLQGGSMVANVGPALHLPLFDAGRLRAQYGATDAELATAVAAYDAAVVDAAHDAANQALNLRRIAERRAARRQQLDAADSMQRRTAARASRGLSDGRPPLQAEAALLDQRDAMLALDGAAVSADIALIRALGGGYRDHAHHPIDTNADKATSP